MRNALLTATFLALYPLAAMAQGFPAATPVTPPGAPMVQTAPTPSSPAASVTQTPVVSVPAVVPSVATAPVSPAGTPAVTAAAAGAFPEGNVENGQRVFNQCRVCHQIAEGRNGVGPSLYQVVNRPAASNATFRYSAAMRERATGGLVWTDDNMRAYLTDPKAVVPAGSMSFQGFRDNRPNTADVVSYLRSTGVTP